MYTCPDKDIHSIYLDNELPAAYIKEYEDHISTCSKCREELEKMRKVRNLFQTDAKAIQLDSHMMDQSFARLESRLQYSKITEDKHIHIFPAVKWSIPAAAAAAVLAVIIPLRISKQQVQPAGSVLAISRQKPAPLTQSSVIVNGNIPHTALTSLFSGKKNSTAAGNAAANAIQPLTAQYASLPSSLEQEEKRETAALPDIDIFRPEFNDQETIRITVPHLTSMPLVQPERQDH